MFELFLFNNLIDKYTRYRYWFFSYKPVLDHPHTSGLDLDCYTINLDVWIWIVVKIVTEYVFFDYMSCYTLVLSIPKVRIIKNNLTESLPYDGGQDIDYFLRSEY